MLRSRAALTPSLTMYITYFFAYHFGNFSAALDLTYPSWLFLLATVLIHVPCQVGRGFLASLAWS